jgi:prolyl 4-hydroxylase
MRQPFVHTLLAGTWHFCRAEPDVDPPQPPLWACKVRQTGYHIIEQEVCGLLIWAESNANAQPLQVEFSRKHPSSCMPPFKKIQQAVEKKLEIPPRNDYQQPMRYFTPQGDVINSDDDWAKATLDGPVFLIEGGQFQWPPVSVGFKQNVDGFFVGGKQIVLETMALKPPIFSIKHLTTPEESDQLVEYAQPKFKQSSVVYMDKDVGKDVNQFRTSLDYRPQHNETKLIQKFEDRAAFLTRIPRSHQEALQILEYGSGGFYHAHDDASRLEFYSQNVPQVLRYHYGYFDRMITLFWYLNDVPVGGETNFPMADTPKAPRTMKKCEQGLMVKPQKGAAVMWYNMHAGGTVSKYGLHGACQVGEGLTKYGINAWIYNKPMATPPAKMDQKHPRWKQIRGGHDPGADAEPPKRNQKKMKAAIPKEASADDVQVDDKPPPNERQVTFQNDLDGPVDVFWVSPQGDESKMMGLEPGFSSGINSFVGHTFVARNGKGKIAAKMTVSRARDQTFNIGDPAHAEL